MALHPQEGLQETSDNRELEVWRCVPLDLYKDIYSVSSKGRVKSLPRAVKTNGGLWTTKERILSLRKTSYPVISLNRNAKTKHIRLSRLIAKAFIPNPNNYPCVCHKDDNPQNNNVNNLFWGTHKMNMQDMIKKGRKPCTKGERNGQSVLSEKKARVIKHILSIPNHISQRQIGEIFGVTQPLVSLVGSGFLWGHVDQLKIGVVAESSHPREKLNKKQVRTIRHIFNIQNHIKPKIIAGIFKISVKSIYGIKYNATWKHVKV